MIFNISDCQFRDIMGDPRFSLPMRWNGQDFEKTLSALFEEYIKALTAAKKDVDCQAKNRFGICVDLIAIRKLSCALLQCVKEYHRGFPATAFEMMDAVMTKLMKAPLRVYQKSGDLKPIESDRLYLFRLRKMGDGAKHSRSDLFHVPSSARSMISTCRYSIAGYPSLYLTTSVELGKKEIGKASGDVLVSRFKLVRRQEGLNIRVLELGIRPQDFDEERIEGRNRNSQGKDLSSINFESSSIRADYLRWYPLIAACSFVRANKKSPFSSEYIIPQLLMQWVRKQVRGNELMGIRYFSCASLRAAELGYDYVFPVSNTDYAAGYCTVLRDAFQLTEPTNLKDYGSVKECEQALIEARDRDFNKI